jgi:hypothetical protein
MKFAWEVINWLIETNKYQSYLEIGTHRNATFDKILCDKKVGVDPSFNTTFKMKSDTFFKQNSDKFDIVFIDGNHTSLQVRKDILNSLDVLSVGGSIVLHDVNPREERLLQSQLCNDAWWAFAELRTERTDLFMCTFPFDHLGYICVGTQEPYSNKIEKSWKYLNDNRIELMNEIEWLNFVKIISNE